HIAGAYLLRYAQESSWREDNRRVSNGDQVILLIRLAQREAIEQPLISQSREPIQIAALRKREEMALEFGVRHRPPRAHAGLVAVGLVRLPRDRIPRRRSAFTGFPQRGLSESFGQRPTNGQASEPLDASFALFEIDWARTQ